MEIEEKGKDIVVRVYVKGSFACSAKVASSVNMINFFQKNSSISLKWKLDVMEAEKRFLENVSALTLSQETACQGWFYNVCELQSFHCPSRFSKLRACIDGKVAMVKIGREQLLIMTSNKLTDRLGLKPVSSRSDGSSLYCIHMSRVSSRSKGVLSDKPNIGAQRSSNCLGMDSDPFTNGFCTWPPDSSLLSKETVSSVFHKQYDMYQNTENETSCARIDHQYIEKKLVKGDNPEKEQNHGKVPNIERRLTVEGKPEIKENHRINKEREEKLGKVDNSKEEKYRKGGKTERKETGEETFPERKRHKSENHRHGETPIDEQPELRKRHKTTSDAAGVAGQEIDKSVTGSVPDKNIHASGKKHRSSGKHEHRSSRKEKHSNESEKVRKVSDNENRINEDVIDLTEDLDSALRKKLSDIPEFNHNATQKVKEKDKTPKKSGKSLLSKLESSLKSLKKKEKDKTEGKKSKHSDKQRISRLTRN